MKDKYYFYAFPITLIMILGTLIASYLFLSCEAQTIVYKAIFALLAIAYFLALGFFIKNFKNIEDFLFENPPVAFLLILIFSAGGVGVCAGWKIPEFKEYHCKQSRYYRSL